MKRIRSITAILLCVALTNCTLTQAQVITDLAAAANAASIAVTDLGVNIPPQVVTYLTATIKALDCASAAADTGGTTTQVDLAIAACGLTSAAPVLPPGTAQNIVNLIATLVHDVSVVIVDYGPISAAIKASKPKPFNVGLFGHHHLKQVRAKLAAAQLALATRR